MNPDFFQYLQKYGRLPPVMTTEKLIETIDELDAAKKEIIRLNQKYDHDTNMAEKRRIGETNLLEWKRK